VPPVSLVNRPSLLAFNALYYHRQLGERRHSVEHYTKFFYPLDGMLDWNKMYGPRGFYQYQCVIPLPQGQAATAELLRAIADSGLGSFLAVLKLCGDLPSPGMLSFPRSGVSLALDFPNAGPRLHALFERLDAIVGAAGGRLYPAKDGRMSGVMFRDGYPAWQPFLDHIDPGCSSSFWRRVMA
jgi:FAD/FMN-containing dehydrogenase